MHVLHRLLLLLEGLNPSKVYQIVTSALNPLFHHNQHLSDFRNVLHIIFSFIYSCHLLALSLCKQLSILIFNTDANLSFLMFQFLSCLVLSFRLTSISCNISSFINGYILSAVFKLAVFTAVLIISLLSGVHSSYFMVVLCTCLIFFLWLGSEFILLSISLNLSK